MHVLGVIPARGGSKRLPNKNLEKIGGRPLVAWAVRSAVESRRLSETLVSTDDEAIKRAAEACGGRVPFMRPAELARDESTSESVLRHAVEWYEKSAGKRPDILVLLQPTSPLRTWKDIDEAIRLVAEEGADSAETVTRDEGSPAHKYVLRDGRLVRWPSGSHEEAAALYRPTGAVYAVRYSVFMEHGTLRGKDHRGLVRDGASSIDIDTVLDLRIARTILRERAETGPELFPSRPFVIAEAGVNHDGKRDLALRLVDIAAEAGADAVKFQTFRPEKLVSRAAPKAAYQKKSTGPEGGQLEMLKRLSLGQDDHKAVLERCRERGIEFLSTPFDEDSADFLDELGVRMFKLGSGELTNLGLLAHVARKGKPMLVSTGMSTLEEVSAAVDAIRENGSPPLALLHCVSDYPARPEDANLLAMTTLAERFGLPVGFSDHTPGIEVSVAAAALGARIIEKHFTSDKTLPGPDHSMSLDPGELSALVRSVRSAASALGDGDKSPRPSEEDTRRAARRSLVLTRGLKAGDRLTADALTAKRPGTGIPPSELRDVVGKTLRADAPEDAVLDWEMLE